MLTRKLMTATAIALGLYAFGTGAQANEDVFVGTVPSLAGPNDRPTLMEIKKVSTARVETRVAIPSGSREQAQFAATSLDAPEDRSTYGAWVEVAEARERGPSMSQFAATDVEGLGAFDSIGLRLYEPQPEGELRAPSGPGTAN